jgi:hypothetical protein
MDPLTFFIAADAACEDGFRLTPCALGEISDAMWEDLAARIAGEPSLLTCPVRILAQRCIEGHAELAVHSGRIVHYSSFAPIADSGTGAHSWAALTERLDVQPEALPTISVYELASGWTDPAWRRMGINRVLRQRLVDRILNNAGHGNALGMSGMGGVAAPLDRWLGWQILAWHAAPFVSSLIGVPAADFPTQAASGWRTPPRLRLYEGGRSPREDPALRWEDFCFCWVSNVALANQLNAELAALMGGDLERWCSAIVTAFEKPESWHSLAFLA